MTAFQVFRQSSTFWIYPLLMTGFVLLAFGLESNRTGLEFLLLWAVGLFAWTLLEYLTHRLGFHGDPDRRKLQRLRLRIHLSHHGFPRDLERLFVRPVYSIPASAIFVGLLFLASGSWFTTGGLMCGLWSGFIYYEWVHCRLHFSNSERLPLKYQRQWHFYHHFVDEKKCFGVTNPLWDMVFGTFRKCERPE